MSDAGAPRIRRKYERFWRTVRSSYTLACWVTYATRVRSAAEPAGRPSTSIDPESTTCTPTIERMRVVLPLPLGPSRPTMRPLGTVSDRPCSTGMRARRTCRSLTTMAGGAAASALFIMC